MYYKHEIFKFQRFYEKKIKKETLNESQLQKVYIYPIYPRDSNIYSDKGFVNLDNGSKGGTHWNCFIIKDKKLYYYSDSFGGNSDKFLLNQLPKPIIYDN